MRPITQYFILKAINPEALSELVSQAIQKENQQPLGRPFSIVRPDGSAFCLQMLALCGPPIET